MNTVKIAMGFEASLSYAGGKYNVKIRQDANKTSCN